MSREDVVSTPNEGSRPSGAVPAEHDPGLKAPKMSRGQRTRHELPAKKRTLARPLTALTRVQIPYALLREILALRGVSRWWLKCSVWSEVTKWAFRAADGSLRSLPRWGGDGNRGSCRRVDQSSSRRAVIAGPHGPKDKLAAPSLRAHQDDGRVGSI